jgi:hypothetical protein
MFSISITIESTGLTTSEFVILTFQISGFAPEPRSLNP